MSRARGVADETELELGTGDRRFDPALVLTAFVSAAALGVGLLAIWSLG